MKYNFKHKAIDVRDCTDEQKKQIGKLMAKLIGGAVIINNWESVGFLYGESHYISWMSHKGDAYNRDKGNTEVHYTDFLKEVNPYGPEANYYVRSTDMEVQERLTDMGYEHRGHNDKIDRYIYFAYNKQWWLSPGEPINNNILSKEQFMMMELPNEDASTRTTFDESCPSGYKQDAYIQNNCIHRWNGEHQVPSSLQTDSAYLYNIMSKKDFKAKHPDKLKFGGYDVIVKRDEIKVGCKVIKKVDLNGFITVLDALLENGVGITEANNFILENRTELGI